MAWIKFETATSDKPEVWQISTILAIDPDAVVGKLLRVWAWFDSHTTTGNAPSVTKMLLDAHVRVTGFCDAMIQAGWMTETNGTIFLPNFDRHNGKTAKTRVLTAKRVAESRSSNASVTLADLECNASIVTDALPREEKIIEEKKLNPPIVPQGGNSQVQKRGKKTPPPDFSEHPLPKEIDTPAMREAWRMWCKHRKEIGHALTETQMLAQFKELVQVGEPRAIRGIEFTVSRGWQGLRYPEECEQPPIKREKTQAEKDAILAKVRADRAKEDGRDGS